MDTRWINLRDAGPNRYSLCVWSHTGKVQNGNDAGSCKDQGLRDRNRNRGAGIGFRLNSSDQCSRHHGLVLPIEFVLCIF